MIINPHDPPPRRWIESTLVEHHGPERVGPIAAQIVHQLRDGDPDLGLARRVIADHPHFLYGRNASNRYAHGGWAYLTLGMDTQAWSLLVTLERTAMLFIGRGSFPVPTPAALIFTYAALRRHQLDAAYLGIQLARLRRLTPPEEEDVELLEACLRASA